MNNLTWGDNADASYVWTFDVSGTDHTITFGSGATTLSGDLAVNGGDITSSGSLNVTAATTNTLTLDTGGAGTVAIGQTATNVDIATSATATNIDIGNVTGATSIDLLVGTGNFTLNGVGGSTYTIWCIHYYWYYHHWWYCPDWRNCIGSGTGVQSLSFGTGGTGAKTVTIGSTASTGVTTIQSGSGGISLATVTTLTTPGTANTATLLCRNSTNQIALCSSTVDGAAFVQDGNTFGVPGVLGTNDDFDLQFETGGVARGAIETRYG